MSRDAFRSARASSDPDQSPDASPAMRKTVSGPPHRASSDVSTLVVSHRTPVP